MHNLSFSKKKFTGKEILLGKKFLQKKKKKKKKKKKRKKIFKKKKKKNKDGTIQKMRKLKELWKLQEEYFNLVVGVLSGH